jgi:hypothetical protein
MRYQGKSVGWLDIFASDRGRISARIRARRDPPEKLVALKGEAGRKPFQPSFKQEGEQDQSEMGSSARSQSQG